MEINQGQQTEVKLTKDEFKKIAEVQDLLYKIGRTDEGIREYTCEGVSAIDDVMAYFTRAKDDSGYIYVPEE